MNDMRERLIKLLIQILELPPCFEDRHYDCRGMVCSECYGKNADRLIANGVIAPPCKVGDTISWVTTCVDENCEEKHDILVGKVVSFSVREEGLWAYCRYDGGLIFWHNVAECFGKTVFLTREEAERALKERVNNDG